MKTEAKKKFALNAVPEAALEEAGLAKLDLPAIAPSFSIAPVSLSIFMSFVPA